MPSTLNPNAPEFYPPPPSVVFPQFFQLPPPPPSFHPQPLLVSTENFNYIPPATYVAHTQTFYTNHTAAFYATHPPPPPPPPPQPQPQVGVPHSYGETRRRFSGDYYSRRGRGSMSGSLMQNRRRDNLYEHDSGEGSGRRENVSPRTARGRNRHRVMPLQRHQEQTTVMIKNIPYDCLREELISLLDEFCLGENAKAGNEGSSENPGERAIAAYDFLYLPIDFRTKKGRGFAFVNFTNAITVWKLYESFHDKNWNRINWPKKIEIVCARIQGKEALMEHFSGSHFECETNEFLPVRFDPARDGSGQAVDVTVVGSRRGNI